MNHISFELLAWIAAFTGLISAVSFMLQLKKSKRDNIALKAQFDNLDSGFTSQLVDLIEKMGPGGFQAVLPVDETRLFLLISASEVSRDYYGFAYGIALRDLPEDSCTCITLKNCWFFYRHQVAKFQCELDGLKTGNEKQTHA